MRGLPPALWGQPMPARPAVYRQPAQMPPRPATAGSITRDIHSAAGNSNPETVGTTVAPTEHSKPQFVPTQVNDYCIIHTLEDLIPQL